MLRPSYSELMETLNSAAGIDNKITSRYAIVIAAAKRSRQIIDGSQTFALTPTDKAVSIAVNEMADGRVKIRPDENVAEYRPILSVKDSLYYDQDEKLDDDFDDSPEEIDDLENDKSGFKDDDYFDDDDAFDEELELVDDDEFESDDDDNEEE